MDSFKSHALAANARRCMALRVVLLFSLLLACPLAMAGPALGSEVTLERPPVKSRWAAYWDSRPPSAFQLRPALELGLLLTSLPTYLAVRMTDNQYVGPSCGQPANPCDPNTVNPFDRPFIYANDSVQPAANFFLSYSMPIMGALMFLDYGPRQWRSYLTDLTIAFESFAVSAAVTYIVRVSTRRPRPFMYIDGAYGDRRTSVEATESFWSGHVSYVMAFGVSAAYLISRRHGVRSPWTWLAWTAALGVGTSSAVLRVLSGDHFLSDVLAAMGFGAGVGLLVPVIHGHRNLPVQILPMTGRETLGLSISGSL